MCSLYQISAEISIYFYGEPPFPIRVDSL